MTLDHSYVIISLNLLPLAKYRIINERKSLRFVRSFLINKYILISFFIPSDITILTQSLNTFVCQQKTSPYIYNKLTQLTSFAQVH